MCYLVCLNQSCVRSLPENGSHLHSHVHLLIYFSSHFFLDRVTPIQNPCTSSVFFSFNSVFLSSNLRFFPQNAQNTCISSLCTVTYFSL